MTMLRHVNSALDHVNTEPAAAACPQCIRNLVAKAGSCEPLVVHGPAPEALRPYQVFKRPVGPLETSTAVVPFKFHAWVKKVGPLEPAQVCPSLELVLECHDLGVVALIEHLMEGGEAEVVVSPAPTEVLGA